MDREVEGDDSDEEDASEHGEGHDGALREELLPEVEADEQEEDQDDSHKRDLGGGPEITSNSNRKSSLFYLNQRRSRSQSHPTFRPAERPAA